jgi:hypothetical protein
VILLQNQSIKENLAKTAMLPVFLSDLEPQKRLDRIMELEKESGVRTKQYLATLFTNYIIIFYGAGEIATIMKQVATDVMSPAQPMPAIDSIQAWSYKNTSLMAQIFVCSATDQRKLSCK